MRAGSWCACDPVMLGRSVRAPSTRPSRPPRGPPSSSRSHSSSALLTRASSGQAAEGITGDEQALAQRRQRVVHEMSAFNFEARGEQALTFAPSLYSS